MVAGPATILGIVLQVEVLEMAGRYLFVCCWVVGIAMWLVYIYRLTTGFYKQIQEREWTDQVW